MGGGILFSEENIISLRTAFVGESQNLIALRLKPATRVSSLSPRKSWRATAASKRGLEDFVWLYRRPLSASDELSLERGPPCVAQKFKAVSFETDPQFTLRWTDSGEGVVVYINGEPWAFIDESNRRGYSKGMIDAYFGNQWNQELFESIFEED